MAETDRVHGYYSERLDRNSTIASLEQRLQAQRARLQSATQQKRLMDNKIPDIKAVQCHTVWLL